MRDQYVVAEKVLDNGYRVEVVYDTDPESPREWCNVGHMACSHSRYNLGDEDFEVSNASLEDLCLMIARHCGIDEELEFQLDEAADKAWEIYSAGQWRERRAMVLEVAQNWLAEHNGKLFYALPLYLYDHSGITMSTTTFSCPWDSGRVGMIFCSHEEAVKEWGVGG